MCVVPAVLSQKSMSKSSPSKTAEAIRKGKFGLYEKVRFNGTHWKPIKNPPYSVVKKWWPKEEWDAIMTEKISREKIKMEVYKRDRFTCVYCGLDLRSDFERKSIGHRQKIGITVDHLRPKSLGGEYTLENLVTACVQCNTDKADKYYEKDTTKTKRATSPRPFLQTVLHYWRIASSVASSYYLRGKAAEREVGDNPPEREDSQRNKQ